MCMLVVLIMHMTMGMSERLMVVQVLVSLGEVQPNAKRHQSRERRQREVSPRTGSTHMP
jgi:hypothetical protein